MDVSAPTQSAPSCPDPAIVPDSRPIDYLSRLPLEVWEVILRLLWAHGANWKSNRLLPSVCRLFQDLLDPVRFSSLELWGRSRHSPNMRPREIYSRPTSFRFVKSLKFRGVMLSTASLAENPFDSPSLLRASVPLYSLLSVSDLSNLTSLTIHTFLMDDAFVLVLHNLSSLEVLHLEDVTIRSLPQSLGPAAFRLSDLRFTDMKVSDGNFLNLASILSNRRLRYLGLDSCRLPAGLLRAISAAVSPGQLERLYFFRNEVEYSEVLEFLHEHREIRNIRFFLHRTLASLPSSLLPNLEHCDALRFEDLTSLASGRPIVGVAVGFPTSTALLSAMTAVASSTKPLRYLTINFTGSNVPWLAHLLTTFTSLEDLDLQCPFAVPKRQVEGIISGQLLSALHSLRRISFSPGLVDAFASTISSRFFSTPDAQPELLWQHARVKEMEASCPSLCIINMKPVSWIRLDVGEWRAYTKLEWDEPLNVPRPLSESREIRSG